MAKVDDLLRAIADEEVHERGPEEDESRAGEHGKGHRHVAAFAHALADALKLARAVILRRVGRHRDAKRHHRHHRDGLDLLRRRIRRDSERSEVVERDLQDDGADRDDTRLEAHRQGDAQVLPVELEVRSPVMAVCVQCWDLTQDEDEAEQIAADLRGERRERGTRYAPVKDEDCDWLEDDVEREPRGEQYRRRLAVAERADEVRLRLEEDEERDARVDQADEGVRSVEDFRRCLHPYEQLAAEQHADSRQDDGGKEREHGASRRAPAHALLVARTEALARVDGEPRREADDKAEHQEHQRARAADGGQGIDAEEAADDQGIDKSVELLEDVARNQRHREEEDEFGRRAFRQILSHSRYLVTKVRSVSCSTVTLSKSASVCGRSFV